jgi:hypothetical protein
MFVPAFDVGSLCPTVTSIAKGSAMSSHAAMSQNPSALSDVADPEIYNNIQAPQNCVGVCNAPPFSGSPWTIPAPQHWCVGAEGMAQAKALAVMPVQELPQQGVYGPENKPHLAEEAETMIGPAPRPAVVPLGFCFLRARNGQKDAALPFVAALEKMWSESEVGEDTVPTENRVRPTPGHVVLCGNAVVLGAVSSLWKWGDSAWHGEAKTVDDLSQSFKESASAHAEAVTPVGGLWLRHHVLKPTPSPDTGAELRF